MLLRNINSILFKVLCCFFVLYPNGANLVPGEKISYNLVHSWADKLGMELFHLGDFITRRKEVQESFKQAQVVSRAGAKIVENMANEIKTMMDSKISAVRRIMDTAENTALTYQSEKPDKYFSYYNSKEMIEPHEPIPTEPPRDLEDAGGPKIFVQPKEIVLTPKAEFFNTPVNMSVSSVHVPTNVYDRASDTIKAIEWSENLDQIFRDNYKKDPTLSWQFFGSSTGFMRQFPASKWKADPVDLYDCRLRSWFMEAATSPKDVIILLDGSGSMTGQRLDIAKHVVNTILDTLGTNDFVNIFTFSDKVKPVVGCFEDTLVQANLGNIRELKEGIELVKTVSIANFSAALTKAFEVLEQFKTEQHGAQCNQAIMIVSDGAPFSYEEIFETYNWQNLPYKPVRVFTYLIGKEVADVKDIKWMACANQGFYVHLSDTAEVREMVLNYIPVMARPLVLGRHDHPVVWTQVYADVVDMEMSDYLWQLEQNADQKENILEYRKVSFRMLDPDEVRRREYRRMKKAWDQPTESDDYHFMTTISMPVYDRRENATKIANLLGVAGTDVPIRDIKKLLSPFLLGVNGYAFIVTNNGYILFHPDFRPIFQRYILKPAYNSVDMIEVELLDDDRPPRDFNPVLLTIRDSIINQSTGSKWMLVKNHFDEMKRVARVKRQYYWTAIQNTPFTLVITYPELYGVYRLQIRTEDEIHRMNIKGSNTLSYFTGKRWKIHPKWLFCKHSNMTFETPEEELLWFLGKMSQPGWKWPSSRSALPPEHTAAMLSNSSAGRIPSFDKDNYYCDRQLMQSLVFDARVTEWFSKNTSFNSKDDKGSSSASNPISVLMGLLPRNEFKQRFGITVAFLATHSGLTRWQEFHSNMAEELGAGESFSEHNNKAIDEIWYKRAVDQHFVREESFVYSVPFDAGETAAETIVTASHAVFHTEGGKSAPAAVVGFQFQHSALLKLFRNITGNACAVDDKDCYVLDNNGFIIISPSRHETGRFFGEINGAIMHRLVEENVYKRVTVYDYQAVCFVPDGDNNSSSNVLTPLFHLLRAFKWLITTIVLYLVEVSTVAADFFEHYVDENMTDYTVNVKNNEWVRLVTLQRTRLKPCDMQRDLYTLYNEKDNVVYNMTAHGCERPFVVLPIPASNLILLVIDQMCPRDATHILTVNPMDINYPLEENQTLACFKRDHEFSRVRPISCISRHVNESNIELCGNASSILINTFLFLITISLNRLL
ncbi:voltage-dependent calcium channel subunit alpha-2/delta-3 isoform X4 [Lucilia cuprina]|uniref:voltage-dependent calcium channel subunit alpha-2/delta-3 isoform X4 n=1 Tax=Lucilia cuprina TaxID=7375 RepID=UPI001F0551A2|nr:voltage-dependent calcium channel subunit alpha-2/delta-3 isoform X4 [Lucilia cuprina]KAI8121435.1 Voltage-dependent calcium channel subunit alpha-2/delta-3 [Lucilia cuprina]